MSFPCPHCSAPASPRSTRCAHCGGAFDFTLGAGDRVARRYEVLDVLRAGALGTTYRVRDLATGVVLALDAVSEALCADEAERAAFVARYGMFAGRTIAGCAMPLTVATEDRFAYVTAPLIDGVTLRTVIDARAAAGRPISAEESLRVLLALVASAAALHSATPHGTLHPESVLVTPRGLVLAGCAVASAVPPERWQARLAAFPRAATYVAPEVLAGRPITAGADLFAVGCIAAELLAGAPGAASLDAVALPPPIDQALRALLERDRLRRPAGLGALLDGLSRACGFERRPAPGPLPVPEPPTSGSPDTNPGHAYSTPVRAVQRPVPQAGPSLASPPARRRTPGAQPVVAVPPPADESARRGATPGRLSVDTAVVARERVGRAQSGPPGGLAPGRSGPPVDAGRAQAGSGGGRPRRASNSRAGAADTSERGARREPDGIDPKLLRAARKLDEERRASDNGEQEIDPDEIETLDD